ncbi:MAG: hypothetical protein ACKOOG_01220 [Actinomycetota bacterium]
MALASIATIGVPRATAAGTASITILVVAEPYDLQDFSYTTTGAGLSSFVLDDDSGIDSTYDNSKTFSALNAGTYTITQAAVPGWNFQALDCTLGSADLVNRRATIVLTSGAEAVCVFTNNKIRIPIENGTIRLGLNAEGHLNIPSDDTSDGGSDYLGVRYLSANAEGSGLGALTEGWGVADQNTGTTGYASRLAGVTNMSAISQTRTASTAVLVTQIGSKFRVTHDFHPSASPNLYEVTVTIKNISGSSVRTRYRRVIDWAIEPTAAAEYVTVETGTASTIVFSSDDGFASADPLAGPSEIAFSGEALDDGPNDHGALFDFDFGNLGANAEKTFKLYYGAAASEPEILGALSAVSAEAYSLGQASE